MRKRSMGLGVLAITLLVTPQALAFGTIRGLGQNAEHERITRRGLAGFGFGPASLDALAGKNGTFGAVGAPDNPLRGLMGNKAAHCDGGDWFDAPGYAQSRADAQAVLAACRVYIMNNIDAAVADAGGLVRADLGLGDASAPGGCAFNGRKGRAKCDVLEDIGMAFHAAQDFYAHSNWVDTPRVHPTIADPQGLDHTAPAPWLSPAGAPFPDGLISGCYDGFPETLHCGGRIRHAVLNKDTAGSARGRAAYDRAMAVAAQDTWARWAYFESRLIARYGVPRGKRMICVLKSDSPGRC
jgi:hypothetical protein